MDVYSAEDTKPSDELYPQEGYEARTPGTTTFASTRGQISFTLRKLAGGAGHCLAVLQDCCFRAWLFLAPTLLFFGKTP